MADTITVETIVNAPIEKVWSAWNTPEDIVKWNALSDDWQTTEAVVDLRVGGSFLYKWEAKDGSFGFEFTGIYSKIIEHELIETNIGDRTLIEFIPDSGLITVSATFDVEPAYDEAEQRLGWQFLVDSFKKYVEAN